MSSGDRVRTRVKRASLRDVAKAAGVSITTASRVFSNSTHAVSGPTRARVLEASDRLGFAPNRLARGLVTSRSQTVGVIVHDISDPYFGDIVRGLEDGLSPEDYRLLVASSDRDPEKELTYLRALISQQVDGIVLAASSIEDAQYEVLMSDTIARYRRHGGVVVLLSEHIVTAPRVYFDNRSSARALVRVLIEMGHRRIAHLRGHLNLATSRVRMEGYREALDDAGIAFDESIVADGCFTVEGGRAAMLELVARGDFSAVFASNDLMAIGATRGLLDQGVDVPAHVSVAGFDDISLAAYAPVPLTTFAVPTRDMGRRGAAMMLELISGGEASNSRVEGSLVHRASVTAGPHVSRKV